MFNWLFNKPGYRRFDDSYALTRNSLHKGLQSAIEQRSEPNQLIFLVAHFPNVFSELQDALDMWEFPYEIIQHVVNRRWIDQMASNHAGSTPPLFLTLAELLQFENAALEPQRQNPHIAIMIAERHPLIQRDRQIEKFSRQISWPVELGYFLALDDEIIKHTVSPDVIQLLKQMGLQDHELVTSHMITRRLNQATKRMSRQVQSEQPADSAKQWFQLNDPQQAKS